MFDVHPNRVNPGALWAQQNTAKKQS